MEADLDEGLTLPGSTLDAVEFLIGRSRLIQWASGARDTYQRLRPIWGLDPVRFLTGGQMSACLQVHHRGSKAVLKIPLDEHAGRAESRALQWWAGSGAVPGIRAVDQVSGAFLMDYVEPDAGVEGPASLPVVADLLGRLADRTGSPEGFAPLSENLHLRMGWARSRFAIESNREGRIWFDAACSTAWALVDSAPIKGALHGDLQDKNILVSGDVGYAIDPLPGFGDATFDAAFWCVMSTAQWSIAERCKGLAERLPDLDHGRLVDWCRVICAIEFRPYLAEQAEQLRAFLDEHA